MKLVSFVVIVGVLVFFFVILKFFPQEFWVEWVLDFAYGSGFGEVEAFG